MKRYILLIIALMLCVSLCSCENLLNKAKAAVTGTEISEPPKDYIATLDNGEYSYELYDDYVKIIEYIVKDDAENASSDVIIPSEIDGKPVTVIGSLCFYDTEIEITSVVIPSSVTTIEEAAFYYADKLVSIDIPDTVTSIGPRAFSWCNSLTNVKIGKGVSELPNYCFNHCSSLTEISIPENITKIGVRAFSYCENLKEIIIAEQVTAVGERAFDGCNSLEFVTVENESLEFGAQMFENCDKVVIISQQDSTATEYCEKYKLRWSTSKDIEAVILGNDASTTESSEISE